MDAYTRANARFEREKEKIEHTLMAMNGGSIAAGGSAIVCAAATKSYVACLTLLGLAAAGPQFFKGEVVEKLQKLEETNFIFLVYQDIKKGNLQTEPVREFMAAFEKPAEDEEAIAGKLVTMMETGEICKSGKPSVRRAEFLERIHAQLYSL